MWRTRVNQSHPLPLQLRKRSLEDRTMDRCFLNHDGDDFQAFTLRLVIMEDPSSCGRGRKFIPWICWHLWISRNKLMFDNRLATPQNVLLQSICAMKEWEAGQAANPNRPTTTPISPPISHLPRPSSMISISTTVCQTDAS